MDAAALVCIWNTPQALDFKACCYLQVESFLNGTSGMFWVVAGIASKMIMELWSLFVFFTFQS